MAYPINYPSSYPKEFVNLVKTRTDTGDFIGFGNPEAYLLIIGKEQAFNTSTVRGKILYQIEIMQNHHDWVQNINNRTSATKDLVYHIPFASTGSPIALPISGSAALKNEMVQWKDIFNPLWPYMALSSAANIPTWAAYQKLVYSVNAIKKNPKLPYCFWKDAFVTEMSQVPSTTSMGISNSGVKNSVNSRINNNILSHDFFRTFHYVVLACGNYVNAAKINAMFGPIIKSYPKVQLPSKTGKSSSGNYYTVYINSNNQIIIHTRQFSNGISDALITAIRKEFGLRP
ncbi:MAG: hypothetical protein LKF31_09640 [Muribaculaceae bacterium]|jgi:hypothetical protein|nr:hypothetical protein [Muribaculaceae bacterium]